MRQFMKSRRNIILTLLILSSFGVFALFQNFTSPEERESNLGINDRGLYIYNKKFYQKGGQPFIAKGLHLIGIVRPEELLFENKLARDAYDLQYKTPYETLIGSVQPIEVEGNQNYLIYQKAAEFGANLVRFQVSEQGLDPESVPLRNLTQQESSDPNFTHPDLIQIEGLKFIKISINREKYKKRIQSAVKAAQSKGLNVLISLQDHNASGSKEPKLMPGDGSVRAWRELTKIFKNNHRIMFELFNEPGLAGNNEKFLANWNIWLDGGCLYKDPSKISTDDGTIISQRTTDPKSWCLTKDNKEGGKVVGMQSLVNKIRKWGAKNIIIAPGLSAEKTLLGVDNFLLNDPLNNLAYGIHTPYMSQCDQMDRVILWEDAFGKLSDREAILVTEWAASSDAPNCKRTDPANSKRFLEYLHSKNIGVVGYAFDMFGELIRKKNIPNKQYWYNFDFEKDLTRYSQRHACSWEPSEVKMNRCLTHKRLQWKIDQFTEDDLKRATAVCSRFFWNNKAYSGSALYDEDYLKTCTDIKMLRNKKLTYDEAFSQCQNMKFYTYAPESGQGKMLYEYFNRLGEFSEIKNTYPTVKWKILNPPEGEPMCKDGKATRIEQQY